jgi:hypothetical protein
VLALAGTNFDSGFGVGAAVGERFAQTAISIEENRRRDLETERNVRELLSRMEQLLVHIESQQRTAPPTNEKTQ